MTEHDRTRAERAQNCNRNDLESLRDAIRGLQSTDDPSLVPLHDELMERYRELTNTPKPIEVHMNTRGCEPMKPETAEALGRVFKATYDQLAQEPPLTITKAQAKVMGASPEYRSYVMDFHHRLEKIINRDNPNRVYGLLPDLFGVPIMVADAKQADKPEQDRV